MGDVYAARDLVRGMDVAIKMLRPEQADGEVARRHLSAEGRAAGRIAHRNVVAVLDAGMTSSDPFVVMELVCGRPLRDELCEHGPLALRRASFIVQQVLAGLQAIHAAGFIHGDVKAENVLVGADGQATLIDLGLMRALDEVHCADEVVSGTPEYMAPEMIRGEHGLIESDLYAVGALLYELVTGTTPFAGGCSIEILCRHLEEDVVPAGLRCPDRIVPHALEDVMQRALQKLPSERFRSARAFACTLQAATPEIEPGPTPMAAMFSSDAATMSWRAETGRQLRPALGTRPPESRRRKVALRSGAKSTTSPWCTRCRRWRRRSRRASMCAAPA